MAGWRFMIWSREGLGLGEGSGLSGVHEMSASVSHWLAWTEASGQPIRHGVHTRWSGRAHSGFSSCIHDDGLKWKLPWEQA